MAFLSILFLLFMTAGNWTVICTGSNGQDPCPPGVWCISDPVTNNSAAFMLSATPVLEGPLVTATSFSFRCVIDFPAQDHGMEMQVMWTFDGQEDSDIPPVLMTPGGGRYTASLDGTMLRGHLGQDVGCKVRGRFVQSPDISSAWSLSNEYRAEIRVDPPQITVGEDGLDKNITITSTIPVICDDTTQHCIVFIALDTSGTRDNIVVNSPCVYQLKSSDWDIQTHTVSTNITTAAAGDKINDGDQHMILSFREIFVIGGPYITIFNGYQLQPVEVVVTDFPTKTCAVVSQSHVTDFRGNYLHFTSVGVYTMYHYQGTSPSDEFELQAHTFPCSSGVSCICGLAVREKQDVIRLDGCQFIGATLSIAIPTAPLREGTVIQRSSDGRSTVIYFPSGREVKVVTLHSSAHNVSYNNVHLTVPGRDTQGTGGGICGSLDSNVPIDHYVHRDGTWESACGQGCVPVSFAESWRVDAASSWFHNVPTMTDDDDNRYCQCDNSDGERRINCSVAADIFHRIHRINGCDSRCWHPDVDWSTGWVGRRSDMAERDEQDLTTSFPAHDKRDWNPDWPTPRGITEALARQRCLEEIQKSQLWARCYHMSSVLKINLDICITDVLYTDSYSMVESALSAFTSQCQIELSQDPSNYITTSDGDTVMRPDLTSDLCSTFCLRHGHCNRGICVCHHGYAGDNCQLDATTGPRLIRIRGSKYCDTNERPCRKIYFEAENFQMGDGFICKSQEVLENAQLSSHSYLERAIFINSNRLACVIPDARTTTDKWHKSYNVSVTYDGNLYGNSMTVTVYDSTCYVCSDVNGCTRKPNTCLIDNLCYLDGDYKPGDATKRCVTSHIEESWTQVS